jgi:hypothetical protein
MAIDFAFAFTLAFAFAFALFWGWGVDALAFDTIVIVSELRSSLTTSSSRNSALSVLSSSLLLELSKA